MPQLTKTDIQIAREQLENIKLHFDKAYTSITALEDSHDKLGLPDLSAQILHACDEARYHADNGEVEIRTALEKLGSLETLLEEG